MMRIGIDCRLASVPTGLGRYVRELIPALLQQSDGIDWVLFVGSKDEEWLPSMRNYQFVISNFSHYSFAEQMQFPREIKRANLDLLFVPHFNVPLRCPVPFAVTIHDLILHRYPNQASLLKRLAYRLVMRHAVKKAKAILSVSRFTATELRACYGDALQAKIHVIPEAVSPLFHRSADHEVEDMRKKFSLEKEYFLYVGNAKEHKNLPVLLAAFREANLSDAELLLVTGGKETAALQLPSSVRMLRDVSDQDLPALYSGANAFVTASLYEGFCLPVLEARACGCPVIASETTAIPELAARGVHLVEPTVTAYTDAFQNWSAPDTVEKPTRTWLDVAKETLSVLTQ